MSNKTPTLFVEINESEIIFVAGNYDNDLKFSILEKTISSTDNFFKDELLVLNNAIELIKKNVEIIESKLDYIFKEVIIILDKFNCTSVSISGYKRLNQSQVLKENISYILNSLKLAVTDNEKNKSILHIFNSKSVLDKNITDNLPIGLFGDFYNHELTFFLIKNNDLKNIKQIFNKNSLNIKKIINKNFIECTQLIDKDMNFETFYCIKIKKDSSSISFFDSSALRYLENFNFGTNLLLQDVSKICSLNYEIINKILMDKIFDKENLKEDDLIENKFFDNNYRKIKKKLIKEIVQARIEEIADVILFKNINTKSFQNEIIKIYVIIEDEIILDNFKKDFIFYFSKNLKNKSTLLKNFEIEPLFIKAAQLSVFGWKKEAIPILQTKKSLITKIFKTIFE